MDSNKEIFFKETCGAIYHCYTKYGDKKLSDWQRWALNKSFGLDQDFDYQIAVDGNKMFIGNQKVSIEYVNGEEMRSRTVKVQVLFD